MSGSVALDLQYLYYNAGLCLPDMVQQWFDIVKVYFGVALAIRILVASRLIPTSVLNALSTGVGIWLMWSYYGNIVGYFIALASVSYLMFVTLPLPKGPLVGGFAILFIFVCEFVAVDPVKWHEMRGSMLLLIMKLVSLGFDIDSTTQIDGATHRGDEGLRANQKNEKVSKTPNSTSVGRATGSSEKQRGDVRRRKEKSSSNSGSLREGVSPQSGARGGGAGGVQSKERDGPHLPPSFLEVMSFALSPLTTIFGPFLTFHDHQQFLTPRPLTLSWVFYCARCLVLSFVCLCVSACIAPDMFLEPTWNKWMAAYGSAMSFRFSHYFISYLSEAFSVGGGLGYSETKGEWSSLSVVKPFDVEVPRSMGMLANSWNLSMYRFLKHYVFKPSVRYMGRFGAYLATYVVSSLLHGINFQLAAVLLSIGMYGYIENVLRSKLSRRLSACVLDKPCREGCSHRYRKFSIVAIMVNVSFALLAMFHLAYLGQMFVNDPDAHEYDYQGFSIWHTLRKWHQLDFLSHLVAAGTLVVALLL